MDRRRIGELLLEAGAVTAADIDQALAYQRETPVLFGQALLRLGAVAVAGLQQHLGQGHRAGDEPGMFGHRTAQVFDGLGWAALAMAHQTQAIKRLRMVGQGLQHFLGVAFRAAEISGAKRLGGAFQKMGDVVGGFGFQAASPKGGWGVGGMLAGTVRECHSRPAPSMAPGGKKPTGSPIFPHSGPYPPAGP